MSSPRYQDYRDSGVEWLGAVPSDWEVARLKAKVSLLTEKSVHRTRPVALENVEGWTGRFLPSDGDYEGDGVAFCKGDILFGKLRPYLAKVYLADEPGEAVGDFHVIRAVRDLEPRFLQYQILNRSFIDVVDGTTFGSKMPRASWEALGGMPVVVPSMVEQRAIADFLDRETSKIDSLITEQERLLALLTEKRQAFISHAVTKGINPDAPMKDSGVQWLGDVPAHWEVIRVKHCIHSLEQGWSPQCDGVPTETEDEWGVLKVGCVNGGLFNPAENKKLPVDLEARPSLAIRAGDVLVSRANTRELVGSSAVVPRDFERLLLCDKLYRIRTDSKRLLPAFLSSWLGSGPARSQIQLDASGASSSMLNIGQGVILEMYMPIPSISEQRDILSAIESNINQLVRTQGLVERSIALLRERRSSLVAAAVTGQIDVREVA